MLIIDTHYGLGTNWWIESLSEYPNVEIVRERMIDQMNRFESLYSRFLKDSDLSKLNQTRQFQNPSSEFIQLLEIAKLYYDLTDGLFNPAVGQTLVDSGYDSTYTFKAKKTYSAIPELHQFLSVNSDLIELKTDGLLDFGGFGKGYLIDKLAAILNEEFGLEEYIINGGGDIYVKAKSSQNLILENPFQPGYSIGTIQIQNESLCCSSNLKRRWVDPKTGKTHHHLINPHSKEELSGVGSFVIAKDCLNADIMATMVCLLQNDEVQISNLAAKLDCKWAFVDEFDRFHASANFPPFVSQN